MELTSEEYSLILVDLLSKKIPNTSFSYVVPSSYADVNSPWVVCSQVDSKLGSVGIGSVIGKKTSNEYRDLSIKGIKISCTIVFDVWAKTLDELNQTVKHIINEILNEENRDIRNKGILKISLNNTDSMMDSLHVTNTTSKEVFRKKLYYNVLGEIKFFDFSESKGYITSIPIAINDNFSENIVIEKARILNLSYDGGLKELQFKILNVDKNKLNLAYIKILDSNMDEVYGKKFDHTLSDNQIDTKDSQVIKLANAELVNGKQFFLSVISDKGVVAFERFNV